MFCTQCGKQNPADARFCAFCGARLLKTEAPEDQDMAWDIPDEPLKVFDSPRDEVQRDSPQDEDGQPPFAPDPLNFEDEDEEAQPEEDQAQEKEEPAPEPDPPRPAVPRRPYIPPRATARPLASNPAQPNRGHRAVRPGPYPGIDTPDGSAPAFPVDYESEKPQRGHRKVSLDEGGQGARIPLSHRPPAQRAAGRSVTPEEIEEIDDLEDWDEEEEEESGFVRARVWLLSIALVAVLVVCAWAFLALTGPGQLFCARMGWAAPAGAYWKLGDDYLDGQQYKNAADAYHDALRLDPDNYDGALQLAKTLTLIGENEDAEKALLLCIQLKPEEAEPYQLLSELYQRLGRTSEAESVKARMPG